MPRIHAKPNVLHQHCKRLDISRDELARRMGVSTATAYRIDTGRHDPSPAFMAALMLLTGAPFEDLFVVAADEQPADDDAAAEVLAG